MTQTLEEKLAEKLRAQCSPAVTKLRELLEKLQKAVR
jgi:hypothetical protein